eukprot:jgi/Undpi1/10453/HiC_scaffold_29.g12903.m1
MKASHGHASNSNGGSRGKRPAPSYHWEGFGRKNTKPPWFDCRVYDKERRDVGWVIKDYGAPSAIEPRREGAAPFVHNADPRLYRPTVPFEGSLSVEVPASPASRVMVPRDVEASGSKGKLTVTHQQALNLEKKAGPSLPYDAAPPPACNRGSGRLEPLNQHMYLPYSRTRRDFPGLGP